MTSARSGYFLTFASLACAITFACWLIAPLGFPFELARDFTPQLTLTCLTFAALAIMMRQRAQAAALAGFTAVLGWAWIAVPFSPVTPRFDRDVVRVAVFNASFNPDALSAAAQWAETNKVDIVMLAEAHGMPLENLNALFAAWPHRQVSGPRGRAPGADWQTED